MTSTNPAESDPAPRPKRRSFSPEYKLRIVAEYDAAPKNEKGAVLRRERLYHSHVKEWRDETAQSPFGVARKAGVPVPGEVVHEDARDEGVSVGTRRIRRPPRPGARLSGTACRGP
ncbi:hypothetical protein [Streptomyces sp. CB09001]|uniref:hypothetical protein n=1 Tax=Streptomyces sp. CB09001 TaxID=2083284 RepID=UPI0013BEA62F|nr:hypothetical protein [Streptomyces sp. CB09001]